MTGRKQLQTTRDADPIQWDKVAVSEAFDTTPAPSGDPSSGRRRRAVVAARLERVKGIGYGLLSLTVAVLVWALVVWAADLPEYVLPTPFEVFERLGQEWSSQLFEATLITSQETVLGFLLAIAAGVPLAVLMTYSRAAERFLYPVMVSAQVIPKVAIAPLFVIWFGFGLMPKVLIAFLIAFFPIVIDTTVGLRSVDPGMLQLARSMGAGRLATFWKVRLPHGLPSFFGGLKVGVTLAVIGAVVGEFVGSSGGLGYVLVAATGNVDIPLVFATIVLMSAIGIVLFALVEVIEKLAMPWHQSQRGDHTGRATA